MRNILKIMILLSSLLWSNSSCGLDTTNIVKELEKKYDKEIKGKNFKPQFNSTLSVVCQKYFGDKSAILVLPYLKKDETEPNSDYYDLSLIIALFDTQTKKIQQSYFHENMAHSEDTWFIKNINVVQNTHPFSVGLEIVRKGASSVYIQWNKSLFLYEKKGKTLNPILLDFTYESLEAEYDIDYEEGKKESFKIKPRKSIMVHPPLLFMHEYKYFNNKEFWKVELDPVILIFKDGKYQQKSGRNGVIFDLKEIEANVKKGLKYKIKVLKAMLYEVPLTKKSLNDYNNIAYYLQKSKHNKEAIFLLEEILSEFPHRIVAYYNLGDAYWALGQKSKAKKYYGNYIKQMKKAGKEKKVPKVVRERAK